MKDKDSEYKNTFPVFPRLSHDKFNGIEGKVFFEQIISRQILFYLEK